MSYQVNWEQDASEALDKLDTKVVERVMVRVYWLAANLDRIKPEALKGRFKGYFKLKAGDYRIVYAIDQAHRLIIIHDIGHRSGVYKDK